MPRRSSLSRSNEVVAAKTAAGKNARNLRKIRPVGHQDMTIYEDRETGERRRVPNKFISSIGAKAAFELAARDKHFEYDDDDPSPDSAPGAGVVP